MEIIVRPDAASACAFAAALLAARIRARPELVLGLATGRTMERLYDELVALSPDLSRARSFNLDEYVGLRGTDPRSYRHFMERALFRRTAIPPGHTHLPDGAAPDPDAEARRYEAAIADAGGIDFQLLGLGETGHIGFNEPLSALMSRTRVKPLTPGTRRQNAPMFGGDPAAVPPRAITMGVGTILDAREIVLLVTGAPKAGILARAVEGPITSMVTASALQMHPSCKVIADEAAAAGLAQREYYDWAFANEPEWAPFRDAHPPGA